MMDRLNTVSVNYNMKINTKKTKVLRVSKGSESDNEDIVAGEIIEQVKEFCYLGNIISDDATEKSREGSQQRRQSGLKSGGSWIRVKKISISTGKFQKIFNFFRQFYKRVSSFAGKFPKILIFFRQLKKFDFPSKNCPFTATSGQIILFLFKSNHFRTYFLYMIRYNNISRPVHDSNDPLRPSLRPPAQNLGVATLSPHD